MEDSSLAKFAAPPPIQGAYPRIGLIRPYYLPWRKFATLFWFTDDEILKSHHLSRQNNECCRQVVVDSVLALKSLEELQSEEHNLD